MALGLNPAFTHGSGEVSDSISDDGGQGYDTVVTITFTPTTPEPGSLLLFGSGIVGLAGVLRRKLMG